MVTVIVPVDVTYKNELRKAHTPFNCDSSDFKRLQTLGAWAIQSTERKTTKTTKVVKE
jgi:hypothetical protein